MRRKPGQLLPLEISICASALALSRRNTTEFHGYELAKHLAGILDARLLTVRNALPRPHSPRRDGDSSKAGGNILNSSAGKPSWPAPGTSLTAKGETAAKELQPLRFAQNRRRGGIVSCDLHERVASALAAMLVRSWTRAYTRGMHAASSPARCAEIESDIWESLHDPENADATGIDILIRFARGMPADLSWRLEHALQENNSCGENSPCFVSWPRQYDGDRGCYLARSEPRRCRTCPLSPYRTTSKYAAALHRRHRHHRPGNNSLQK